MAWALLYVYSQEHSYNPKAPAGKPNVRDTIDGKKVKRILVVDDDPHSREGLREALQSEGYRVETAPDSWEGIRKIKEDDYDVAIVDLDLPAVRGVVVTGWDLARIFPAYRPGISIIVISAEAENAQRSRAGHLGVSEFLEKPISPTRLRAIVRALGIRGDARPTACLAGSS
jgi:DNA-binding response OmpR family regulator